MDCGAGFPYLAVSHFHGTRHVVRTHGITRAAVYTHRGLCLSSARIWSLGFSPNLGGKKKRVAGGTMAVWKHPWKQNAGLCTYLSRKSLSTTAEMSSRGFPIPKSVFSLCRYKSTLFHSDSQLSSLQRSLTCFWYNGSGQCRCYYFRHWPLIGTSAQTHTTKSTTNSKVTPLHFEKTAVFNGSVRMQLLIIYCYLKTRKNGILKFRVQI